MEKLVVGQLWPTFPSRVVSAKGSLKAEMEKTCLGPACLTEVAVNFFWSGDGHGRGNGSGHVNGNGHISRNRNANGSGHGNGSGNGSGHGHGSTNGSWH